MTDQTEGREGRPRVCVLRLQLASAALHQLPWPLLQPWRGANVI